MFCRINYAVPVKPDLVRFSLVTFETRNDGEFEMHDYEVVLNVFDMSEEEIMTQLTFKIRELIYMSEQCRSLEGREWKM